MQEKGGYGQALKNIWYSISLGFAGIQRLAIQADPDALFPSFP